MKRRIIFGGSFDPIHSAHIDIIEKLCARFDEVIVVPCKLSPFKTTAAADADVRLEMLKIALSHTSAIISSHEIFSKGANFSYLTASKFAEKGVELFWAIGSEMVSTLPEWMNFEQLRALVHFYVINRPHYDLSEADTALISKIGGEVADFSGKEGSSSEVKISIAMGKPHLFLSRGVSRYITEHKLYRDYVFINDLYKKYRLTKERINHSYSAALCGTVLSKRLNVSTGEAAIALLLHDIGKSTSIADAEKMGIILPDYVHSMPLSIQHAEIGAEILKQKENINDVGIINAVRYHTTGKPDMTALEIVVFLSDFIEPTRKFSGAARVREATKKDVMQGFLAALEETIKFIPQDKIYHTTKESYNFYKNIVNK